MRILITCIAAALSVATAAHAAPKSPHLNVLDHGIQWNYLKYAAFAKAATPVPPATPPTDFTAEACKRLRSAAFDRQLVERTALLQAFVSTEAGAEGPSTRQYSVIAGSHIADERWMDQFCHIEEVIPLPIP
jgi:hypothetical protein